MWKRPVCRNDWSKISDLDKPRHENWQELFFDLFYVALFLKLGDIFKYCGLKSSVMAVSFFIFFVSWLSSLHVNNYVNRFYSEDLVHKLFFFLQHAGLFIMILNVNETNEHSDKKYHCNQDNNYVNGWAIGYCITRLGLVTMYGVAMIYHKKARGMFTPHLISWILGIIQPYHSFLSYINQSISCFSQK